MRWWLKWNISDRPGRAPDVNQQTEAARRSWYQGRQKETDRHRNNNNNNAGQRATGNSCMRRLCLWTPCIYDRFTPVMHCALSSAHSPLPSTLYWHWVRLCDRKWRHERGRSHDWSVHCWGRDIDRYLTASTHVTRSIPETDSMTSSAEWRQKPHEFPTLHICFY